MAPFLRLATLLLLLVPDVGAATSTTSSRPIWSNRTPSSQPASGSPSETATAKLGGVEVKGPTAPLLNSPSDPEIITQDKRRREASTQGGRLICTGAGGKILKSGDPGYEQCIREAQSGQSPQSPAGTWGSPGNQLWLRN